jgi:hypothetical protein
MGVKKEEFHLNESNPCHILKVILMGDYDPDDREDLVFL